jgi:hypothetical protein
MTKSKIGIVNMKCLMMTLMNAIADIADYERLAD